MRKIGKWLVPLALLVLVLSVPMTAMAVYSPYAGSWQDTSAGVTTGISPTGLDITNAYHAYSEGSNYFQIDLVGSTNTVTGTGSVGTWKINISTTAPANSTDIDYTITYVKNGNTGAFTLGNTNLTGTSLTGSAVTNNDTSYLQWQYSDSGAIKLGRNFYWWAETLPKTGAAKENTFANAAHATPIPNAAWLLGSGIIGLIGLQRRRAKKV